MQHWVAGDSPAASASKLVWSRLETGRQRLLKKLTAGCRDSSSCSYCISNVYHMEVEIDAYRKSRSVPNNSSGKGKESRPPGTGLLGLNAGAVTGAAREDGCTARVDVRQGSVTRIAWRRRPRQRAAATAR
jgi:hypothetical protein